MRAEILNAIISKINEQKESLKQIAGNDVTVSDVDIAIIKPPKIIVKLLRENITRYISGNVSRYDGGVSITVVLHGNVMEGLVSKLLATIDKLEEILSNKPIIVENKPIILYLSDFVYDISLEERVNGYAVAQVNFEIRR